MTIINNITNISLSNEYTNSSKVKLIIFKKSLTQLLIMPTNLYERIFSNKSPENTHELYCLDMGNPIKVENGLEIVYAGTNYYITKIFIQKSNKYKNYKKNFTSFNIIGYYLINKTLNQERWYALSYFKENNHDAITKNDNLLGGILVKKNNKNITLYLKYISQTENTSIDINNLMFL